MDKEDILYIGTGLVSMCMGSFSIKASWRNWKREKKEVLGLYDRLDDKLKKIVYDSNSTITKEQVSSLASDLSYAANNSDVKDVVSHDITRLSTIISTYDVRNTKQQQMVRIIAEGTERNFSEIREEATSDVTWEYIGKTGFGVGLGMIGALMIGGTIYSLLKRRNKKADFENNHW